MDSFHASCEGLKGPHFIHLFKFTLQISHNPHTGLQPNRRGAWFIHETTLTSQPGRERLPSFLNKMWFVLFFRPISGFFPPDFGYFRPSFQMTKDDSGKLLPELVTKQALSISTLVSSSQKNLDNTVRHSYASTAQRTKTCFPRFLSCFPS